MDIDHLKTMGFAEATTPTGKKFLLQDMGENRQTFGRRYEYRISFGCVDLSGSSNTLEEVYTDIEQYQSEFGLEVE